MNLEDMLVKTERHDNLDKEWMEDLLICEFDNGYALGYNKIKYRVLAKDPEFAHLQGTPDKICAVLLPLSRAGDFDIANPEFSWASYLRYASWPVGMDLDTQKPAQLSYEASRISIKYASKGQERVASLDSKIRKLKDNIINPFIKPAGSIINELLRFLGMEPKPMEKVYRLRNWKKVKQKPDSISPGLSISSPLRKIDDMNLIDDEDPDNINEYSLILPEGPYVTTHRLFGEAVLEGRIETYTKARYFLEVPPRLREEFYDSVRTLKQEYDRWCAFKAGLNAEDQIALLKKLNFLK